MKKSAQFLPLSLILSTASIALASPITLYYENRAPFTYLQDGELVGSEGKVASEAFREAGIDFTLSEAPGAREIDMVGKNFEATCAVGIYRTADRDRSGKFTLPISIKQAKVVVIRADNPKINSYTTLSDLLADPTISLVMRNGYSYGYKVDAMLVKAKARLKRPPEESHGRIKMVLEGMADGALFTPLEADYQIAQFGEAGKLLLSLQLSDSPPGEPSYLYCSRSVDDKIITRLNDVLKKHPVN